MTESTLNGPKRLGPYPDHELDCQEAMEDAFLALMDQVESAGWLRTEAYAALIELIDNHLSGDEARDHVYEVIGKLRRDRA